MSDQLPPADELEAVRSQIKALETRERELRTVILTDKEARVGNRFIAEVVHVTSWRTDLKELRAAHPEAVKEHTYKQAVEKIELRLITEDGEIIARPKQQRT